MGGKEKKRKVNPQPEGRTIALGLTLDRTDRELQRDVAKVLTEMGGPVSPDEVEIVRGGQKAKRRGKGISLSHLPDGIAYPPPSKLFGGKKLDD
jgi:hypothetical protein